MDTIESTPMTSIQEGDEQPILRASKYLKAQGIRSTVTLAEDCRPGT